MKKIDGVYRWQSKAGRLRRELNTFATIEQVVQRYVDDIRAKKPGTQEAKQLYRSLIQPIGEMAVGRRFVIVPDGILNLMPFDALQNSDNQYLLKSAVVSYAPSATVLDALRRSANPATVIQTSSRTGRRPL